MLSNFLKFEVKFIQHKMNDFRVCEPATLAHARSCTAMASVWPFLSIFFTLEADGDLTPVTAGRQANGATPREGAIARPRIGMPHRRS